MFVKHEFDLRIKNFSSLNIVVAEKFNLVSSLTGDSGIAIPSYNPVSLNSIKARLHTLNPVLHIFPETSNFELVNSKGERYQVWFSDFFDKDGPFTLGVGDRPEDEEWWDSE
jgi:hypothetical protein